MTFADLGLSDELLRAVSDSGYHEPTPIQRAVIPSVLMGKDLIGIAQTGTGKTAGFVLPMIDILHEGRSRARMPRKSVLKRWTSARGLMCFKTLLNQRRAPATSPMASAISCW